MANQLTLGVGINAASLQAAINNVVNRTYTIAGVQVNNRGIAQAQQALGRITGSASEFQKSMEAANARVVAFGASAGVIYVLKRAFDGLISSTIEVEKSIAEINSILNLSSRQISTFSSQLFSAANSVSVSFDDASKAATEFARQGLGVEQTLKRTRDSLILAKISGMDFADSATAITAALNSFSNELITSADLVDRLTNADAHFAVSSRDLAEAIKRVGSSASEANISLNETIALVTAAQQTTARGGAVIGNSFKTIFARLSRGSVLNDLEAIGIKTKDASGNTLPLIQVLKNLSSTYDTLSSRQQSFVAEMVGGVYQINILKATLRDLSSGASVFSQALSTLENSTGSAQARINQLNETISAKLIVTLNNLKEISSAIGSQTFAPVFKGGLDVLNSQLETFKEFSGEGIGKRLADGILGGIKGALAGPGAFFAGFFATKLLGNFGRFVTDSVSSFAGLNSAAQQQAQIQNQIVQYLQRNPTLLGRIHSGALTVAQAHQHILDTIRQENTLLAYQTQQAGIIARMAYRSGVRVAPASAPGPARGYIPNFSNGFIPNFSPETSLAKSLGASAGVKEVPGKGEIGGSGFVANSQETQIPNFAGSGETAVIPHYGGGREKAAKMIAAGKSGPILAGGFIPNFYKDEVSDIRILRAFLKIQKQTVKKGAYRGNLDESGKLPVYRGVTPWKSNMTNEDHFSNPIYPRMGPTGYRSGPLTQELHKKDLSSIVFDHQNAQHIYSNAVSTSINKGIAREFGTSVGEKRLNPLRILGNEKEYEKLYRAFGEARVKSVIFRNTKALGGRGLGLNVNEILPDSNFTHEDEIAILSKGFIPNFASSYLLKNLKQKIDLGIASQDDIKLYNEMSSSTPSGMSFSGEKTFSNKFGKAVLATTGAGGYDISSVNIPPKMRGQGGSYDLYDQMFKFLRESGVKKVGGVLLGQGKGASQFPFATLKRRLQFGKGTTVELLNGKTVTLKSMEDLIKFSKSVSPKDIRAGLDVSTVVANGFIPNFALKLLDKDYLAQVHGGAAGMGGENKTKIDEVFNEIVNKAAAARKIKEIVVGAPGVGKTTLAMSKGAKPIASAAEFDPGKDELIAVRSILSASSFEKDETKALFGSAEKITMLRVSQEVVDKMREKRDSQIRSGTSKTGFGRKAGSTSDAPADSSVMEAILTERYADKLKAFRRNEDFSLTEVSDRKTIKDIGSVAALVGNFGPFTKGHEKLLAAASSNPIIYASGGEINRDYGLGFSAAEKIKLIEKQYPDIPVLPLDYGTGMGEMFNYKGQVYRYKQEESEVVLGADRAEDPKYTGKFTSKGFKINAIPRSSEDISATLARKAVVENDLGTLAKYLPDKIFEAVSSPSNMTILQKRAALIQQRKDKAAPLMQLAQENLDKFVAIHGNRKKPKEDPSITETRNALKAKLAHYEKKVAGKFKGGVFGRMGLKLNLANGFIPNFAPMQLTQFKPTASERELQGGKVPFAAEEISSVRQFLKRLREKYPQMSGIRALMTGGRSQEKRIERGSNFTGIDSVVSGMLGGKKFAFMIQTKAGKPKNVKEKDLKFEQGLSDLQKSNPEFLKDVHEFVNILSLSSRNKPEGFQKKLPEFGSGFIPNFAAIELKKRAYDYPSLENKGKADDKDHFTANIVPKELSKTNDAYNAEARALLRGRREPSGLFSGFLSKFGKTTGKIFQTEKFDLWGKGLIDKGVPPDRIASIKTLIENAEPGKGSFLNIQNAIKGVLGEVDAKENEEGSKFTNSGSYFDIISADGRLLEVRTRKTVSASDILRKGINQYLKTNDSINNGEDDDVQLGNIGVILPKGSPLRAASGFIPNFNKLLNTPMGTAMRVKAGSLQEESILVETVPQSSIKFSGDVEDFIKQIETSAGRKLTKGELRVLRYAPYFNKLNGLENPSALQRFLHSETKSEGFASLASGFIPNFARKKVGGRNFWLMSMGIDPNSVNRALNTERSAGKGAELRADPLIGPYVAQPGQPSDLKQLIKQDHPEGLSAAIQNSKKSQGLARGFIPNFAAESDTGAGTSALVSAIFGSIAAMRQNTESIRNQTRAQNLNTQIERSIEPELIQSASQGTGGLLGDIKALFGKGQDIRNLKEVEQRNISHGTTVAAARTATQVRKSSAAQSLTIPAMAIGPGISAVAGAMDQGPAKAAMENFSNSANIASAAFAAFPGPVGAGVAGVLLVGGAARSLYKYFNDYGPKIALAIEAQENTNKQFESNGQAVIQGYAKLNDAMYNASISASQMSQIQDQINSSMANIPESLKREFQTRIKLAANQEERAAIFAQMNSKRASETEALKTFNVGQKEQEDKFGNRQRYFDRGFFGRMYKADLSKKEMEKGKGMASAEASSIISYAKQNLSPATMREFAKGNRSLENIVPDDMVGAVREMDTTSRNVLELTIKRQLAEEALNKKIDEEFKTQLEAERELKRSAQERINLAREEAVQLNKLADAMSTFSISAESTLRNAELKGQTDVFGTRMDIAKQKTGAGTGAMLEARSDFFKKTSAIEQTRSEKTSKAIQDILSKGTGDKKEGASLTEGERQSNMRISSALKDAGGDIEKAKRDRSITAEDLKRMKSPELENELKKINLEAQLQNKEAKIQSDYLYQSLKAQADFQRNLKVGGGISGFTNPSQRRDMAGSIAVSAFGLGSSSVEGKGRSAFDLLKNTQGLMGGALKNTPAVQSLKELAVKGNQQSLLSTFGDAIQGLKMSGNPQAAGMISQFQELMAQSRKISEDQVEADLQLEELPQKTLEVAQQQLEGLKNIESAVTNGLNSLTGSIAQVSMDIGAAAATQAAARNKDAKDLKDEEEKRSQKAQKDIDKNINAFKNGADTIAVTFKNINKSLEDIYRRYEKKQQGGLLASGGMVNGPSHARGGVPIFNRGNQIAEVEGGEYVINKRSTAANIQLIEAINSAQGELKSGGVVVSNVNSRRFESGGEITSVSIPNQSSPVNLSVAVNPASKEFGGSLTFPDANSILEMINVLSAKINEINISMLNQRDDQKNLAPGIYR